MFAFGVTGSGKTHTVQGADEDPGILPRALDCMFASIQGVESQSRVGGDVVAPRASTSLPMDAHGHAAR